MAAPAEGGRPCRQVKAVWLASCAEEEELPGATRGRGSKAGSVPGRDSHGVSPGSDLQDASDCAGSEEGSSPDAPEAGDSKKRGSKAAA